MGIIMPHTDRVGATVVAKMILNRLLKENIYHPSSPFGRVTVSIGIAVAEYGGPTQSQQLVEAADAALYEAKAGGRNQFQ